ncbi:DUF3800 domain-containing protein [Sphingobacterium bovistauri]|uniref:DUF3800 domain-containing protein n=1 Tax=Sphingobacterium bovistauri TaxID=2781959 RepID=A0ABS7Z5Q4_9SPHI|nr:DUF3800 domain-containing protein [Sphingobacterium bovistauri]MCA5005479.1 DUF3800 domain-containing protein [Sphingobacterium bovistauri]
MYVDESGDVGVNNSPTRYFILSAIVIHELRWKQTLESLVEFRKFLRDTKGLKLREEIHCTELINKPGKLIRIKRNDRLDIIKKCIDWLNLQPDLNVFSVVIDKNNRNDDIFELAWNTLIMRFENTISNKNFRGPSNTDDRGMILSDNTEGTKLRRLVRKMRHYNTIPNKTEIYNSGYRNIKINSVIENPVLRDSQYSFLHQMNDVLAYCIKQKYQSNTYMKKKGGDKFYKRLDNVTVKMVTSKNNYGIVEI